MTFASPPPEFLPPPVAELTDAAMTPLVSHGRATVQVRANWSALLDAIPDFQSDVLRVAARRRRPVRGGSLDGHQGERHAA
jgi:hypothetical protein